MTSRESSASASSASRPAAGPRVSATAMARLIATTGEPVIAKTWPSAFFGTNLASYLIYHRVDTLVVTGMVTSGCVRGTAIDAFSHNYRVIVPQECVADRGQTSHKVALFEIHMKYGDVLPAEAVISELEAVCAAQRAGSGVSVPV